LIDKKIVLGIEFDSINQASEVETNNSLTYFIVDNMECGTLAREQFVALCGSEEELIALKVKEEIMVSPLREYIKDWKN
jgi:hypothetical protein